MTNGYGGGARQRIFVEDGGGRMRREARVAADVTLDQLVPALANALGLPLVDGAGRALVYDAVEGERVLPAQATLQSAGVKEGKTLVLVPVTLSDPARPEVKAQPESAETRRLTEQIEKLAEQIGRLVSPANAERSHIQESSGKIVEAVRAQMLVQVTPPPMFDIFGEPPRDPQYKCDAFMAMAFNDKLDALYRNFIKPTVEDAHLTIRRADDFFTAREVMQDIWAALNACRFVIAECTGRNPNVFYELGIAHVLGKPTILLTKEIDDLPFDLRGRRAICYAEDAAGLPRLREELRRAIERLSLKASKE
jgi:hypothetical protein